MQHGKLYYKKHRQQYSMPEVTLFLPRDAMIERY